MHDRSPNRQYISLDLAHEFFNAKLFDGALPHAIITFQRQAGARGYYSPSRFEGRAPNQQTTDEIALNPGTFADRTDKEILSTLVHEMVHAWQQHFGTPSRGRYHNREWANKMIAVGLMPSATGLPGGPQTGQHMTHYIVGGGPFERACDELLANGVRVEWQSREQRTVRGGRSIASRIDAIKLKSKTKFSCPVCSQNVWGKPDTFVVCGTCSQLLVAAPDALDSNGSNDFSEHQKNPSTF